jgi:hypothetical protein
VKKKPIKPIKILKKLAGSVLFRFYKSKIKKIEPKKTKQNRQKTEPKRKNRAKPV